MNEVVELVGVVQRVVYDSQNWGRKPFGNPVNFFVWTSSSQTLFECIADCGYLPIEAGDRITANVRGTYFDGSEVLHVEGRPLVGLGKSEEEVISRLTKSIHKASFNKFNKKYQTPENRKISLKEATLVALEFYAWINNMSKEPVSFLTSLANTYRTLEDSDLKVYDNLLNIFNSHQQLRDVLKEWTRSNDVRSLHLLGLNNTEIRGAKGFDGHSFGNLNNLYNKITEDPYSIITLPIEKCKEISLLLGLDQLSSDENDAAMVVRELLDYTDKWNVIGMKTNVFKRHYKDKYDLNTLLPILRDVYGVRLEYNTIYLQHIWFIESTVGAKLLSLNQLPLIGYTGDVFQVTFDSDPSSPTLTEEQEDAVVGLLSNNICVLSSKAGSGKTTLIKQVYRNLLKYNIPSVVLSFTGRAVHRIKVATGIEAYTIHRFLCNLRPSERIVDEPSMCDVTPTTPTPPPPISLQDEALKRPQVVIIDEASMVSLELFWLLGVALDWHVRFILVGDVHQLPPIEFGNPLKCIVDSNIFNVYRLSINHRQTDGGVLARLCSDMSDHLNGDRGACPLLEDGPDIHLVEGENTVLEDLIKGLLIERKSDMIDELGRLSSLCVITPLSAIAEEVNRTIQKLMCNDVTKTSSLTDERGRKWNIGDRVLLTANDYLSEVFNGTEGFIVSVKDGNTFTNKSIVVHFPSCDTTEVIYPSPIKKVVQPLPVSVKGFIPSTPSLPTQPATPITRLKRKLLTFTLNKPKFDPADEGGKEFSRNTNTTDSLLFAYAVTVHKAQGAEYPYVIFYSPSTCKATGGFYNRNLAYTALTRARDELWVVGNIDQVQKALRTKATDKGDNLTARFTQSE